MNEREKRKKNVIIHGVTESARENLTDKRADDDAKIKEIFKTVGKEMLRLLRCKIKRYIKTRTNIS